MSKPIIRALLGDNKTPITMDFRGGVNTDFDLLNNEVDINIGFPPPFPDISEVIEVFFNASGSDTEGDGSFLNPFFSLERAALVPPLFIPDRVRYVLDGTGKGMNLLPDDYTLPAWKSSQAFVFVDKFYQREHAVNIVATPAITTKVPAIDAEFIDVVDGVFSVGPNNLIIFTLGVARPSWTPDILKGCFLQGFSAYDSGTIKANTTTTLTIDRSNTLAGFPIGPFRLTEPTLTIAGAGIDNYGALTVINIDSFGIKGVKLINTDAFVSPFALALTITNTAIPVMELCDIEGFFGSSCSLALEFFSCVIRTRAFGMESCVLLARNTLWLDIQTFEVDSSGQDILFEGCSLDNCAALGTRPFDTTDGSFIINLQCVDGVIDGSIVDSVYGTPGYGILMKGGGNLNLENFQINDCDDQPIHIEQGLTFTTLRNVTGSGNGIGSGVGSPQWTDGSVTRVMDDATDIGEDAGGFICGDNVATPQLWATFRVPPVPRYNRDMDATLPMDVKGTGTLTFQK